MTEHEDDCFLSGGDDGRFPCICGLPRPNAKAMSAHPKGCIMDQGAAFPPRCTAKACNYPFCEQSAQGIAAPSGGKTGTGLTVGKSPTPLGDAPERSPS